MTLQDQLQATYEELFEAARQLNEGEENPVLNDGRPFKDYEMEAYVDTHEVVYTLGGPMIYAQYDLDACEAILIAEHGEDRVEMCLEPHVAEALGYYYFG